MLQDLRASLEPYSRECSSESGESQSATPTGEEDDVQTFSANEAKRAHNRKLYERIEEELQSNLQNVRQLEVPDYLLCRITDELMEEPAALESGFTYERSQIIKHFEKNGNFDPMTREEVNPAILIPNKSLKYASQEFLLNNPWAFERVYGETLEQIKM